MSQFHMDESNISFLQVPLLAGVAAGGLACGRLADSDRWHRVLAPAALAMGAAMMLIAAVPLLGNTGTDTDFADKIGLSPRISLQIVASCLLLFCTGAAGGILLVPLEAFIQARPPADRKGQVIAAANCTAFIGILLGGMAFVLLDKFMRPTAAFGVLGALTLLVGAVVRKAMPRE
jgi:MFS family permease